MVRFSVESGKKDGDGGSREKTRRLLVWLLFAGLVRREGRKKGRKLARGAHH